MQVRKLKTLVTVAQTGSFSRAAALLYVTQPTVTSRILELERELNCDLFIRERHGVVLTEAGRVFLRYAQRCLRNLEDGRAAVAAVRTGVKGRLRIMACAVPATCDLPPILTGLAADMPGSEFHVKTAPSKEIFRSMLRGEVDVALVNIRFHHPELDTEIVCQRPMALVGSIDRAAGRTGVSAEEPIFFLEEELEDALLIRSICNQLGISTSATMGISCISALRGLVAGGLGVAILPRDCVATDLESGLLQEIAMEEKLPLLGQITCLTVRREAGSGPLSLLVYRFTQVVREYYRSQVRSGAGNVHEPPASTVSS